MGERWWRDERTLQILQPSCGGEDTGASNCVPQAVQIRRSSVFVIFENSVGMVQLVFVIDEVFPIVLIYLFDELMLDPLFVI